MVGLLELLEQALGPVVAVEPVADIWGKIESGGGGIEFVGTQNRKWCGLRSDRAVITC